MAGSRRGKPPKIWAAGIVVAAAIVIAILVVSYSFNNSVQGRSSNQPCVPQSGFYCQDVVFHNGVLSLRFGQGTGTDWTSGVLYFVPYGQPYDQKADTYSEISGLDNRVFNVTIAIPSSVASGSPGSELVGFLYVNYTMGLGANATHALEHAATIAVPAT